MVFHLTQQPGCLSWCRLVASPGHHPYNTFSSCGQFFWWLVIKLYWVLNLDPVQRSARPVSAWHVTRDPRDTSQVEYVCDQSCVWGAAQLLLATSGLQTMLKILSTHHSLKVDKVKVDISIQSIFLDDETLIKLHNLMKKCFKINISRFVVQMCVWLSPHHLISRCLDNIQSRQRLCSPPRLQYCCEQLDPRPWRMSRIITTSFYEQFDCT